MQPSRQALKWKENNRIKTTTHTKRARLQPSTPGSCRGEQETFNDIRYKVRTRGLQPGTNRRMAVTSSPLPLPNSGREHYPPAPSHLSRNSSADMACISGTAVNSLSRG